MKVNGMDYSVKNGTTLLDFLMQGNYHVDKIAVERNGEIVPRESYESILLTEVDVLEIVSFVGGG